MASVRVPTWGGGGLEAAPLVESKSKVPGGRLEGQGPPKADAYFYWKKPRL